MSAFNWRAHVGERSGLPPGHIAQDGAFPLLDDGPAQGYAAAVRTLEEHDPPLRCGCPQVCLVHPGRLD